MRFPPRLIASNIVGMDAPAVTSAIVLSPVRLDAEFAATAEMPRAEAVAACKNIRQRELTALGVHMLNHVHDLSGYDVVAAITSLTDSVLRTLAQRAFTKVGAPSDWPRTVGVFALGGYGRGEMNPYSDLDLLVLSAGSKQPEWLAKGYAELQALLWDVKFTVGASQRTAAELTRILDEDFVTATAVVEQRPVLAEGPVVAEIESILVRLRRRQAVPFLRFKLEELEKRRDNAGISLFRMEPNLKSNPGCLRDVQLLHNMAFIAFGGRDLMALEQLEVITRQDLRDVLDANDHLLKMRSLLHFHHQKKQDVFQLADQVRIARLKGFTDVSSLRAVEHFMKAHYARVFHVHQMVDLTVSRLRDRGFLGRKPILVKTRKVLDGDATVVQGRVYFGRNDFWHAPDAGARLLRICRTAQQHGLRLSLELQRTVKGNLGVITDEVRSDPALGRQFLEMLGDAGRLHPILSDMHNAGLLGAYLPEFGNLTCHMQFDSYHQYTVDQHTLLALKYLDDVANGTAAGLPGMGAVFKRLPRKDLLALGLLLHDMGKYMGRGHVARGAIMVADVARRLGLDETEEDHVYFLVERHVSLSDASRMRNIHEPSFLRQFSDRMGSQANLDALYCLTWCDAKAVGDGVLTGWQEAILGELYRAVSAQLAGAEPPAGHHTRLVQELLTCGLERDAAEAWLDHLPGSYSHQVQPKEAVEHQKVVTQARAEGVGLSWQLADAYIHLAAAVPDRHALMADVTATLSGHGFDILDARTWVTNDGMVIYNFRLTSIYPTRIREAPAWQRLRNDLLAVSQNRLDAGVLLDKRRTAIIAKPADSGFDDRAVKVEQRTSDHHTIVDIHTKDAVGLLSRLCRGISAFGCEISYASINTMGDVAVDVFYVQLHGRKLTDDEAERLRLHLGTVLDQP